MESRLSKLVFTLASATLLLDFSILFSWLSGQFFLCSLSPWLVVNPFKQKWQTYGRSPVWVLRWTLKSIFSRSMYYNSNGTTNLKGACCPNRLPQNSHEYGFSPVCTRSWVFRYDLTGNRFPHQVQTKGNSPLCTLRCSRSFAFSVKVCPQLSHKNALTFFGFFSLL